MKIAEFERFGIGLGALEHKLILDEKRGFPNFRTIEDSDMLNIFNKLYGFQ
jgi:hypothetical protein